MAFVHRNLRLCFRLFESEYDPPPLTVLLCDNIRIGNLPRPGLDSAADRIPDSTKTIIYPSALCLGDAMQVIYAARWIAS